MGEIYITMLSLLDVQEDANIFTLRPPAIEAEVEFTSDTIARAEKGPTKVVEATEEGEKWWARLCEGLAENSLFWKAEDVSLLLYYAIAELTINLRIGSSG